MIKTKENALKVHIRHMLLNRDLSQVKEIENSSFEFPWEEENFNIYTRLVAEIIDNKRVDNNKIVGYFLYELYKNKIIITNLAVHPEYRRMSIGTQMIEKLKTKLSPYRRIRINLEVRETNLEAQLFFKYNGFRAISIIRNLYRDTNEDAYLMQFVIPTLSQSQLYNPINRISGLI